MDGPSSSGQLLILALQFGLPLALIVLGCVAGRVIERRHFQSIISREAGMTMAIPTNLKRPPDLPVADTFLVVGSVVIASDYFKTLGAGLKSLVGGRLGTLETLVERARREAILRMREQAAYYGAQMVLNVRLETSSVGGVRRPMVEVMAYGTAVILAR